MTSEAGTPLVSVVIPARNVEGFVRETITSLRVQTEKRFECIVLDDESSDGTASAAAAAIGGDGRFKLVEGPHQGVGAARNMGAGLTNAPYLLFLDADDLLAPDALGRAVEALSRADDNPAVLGRIARIDEAGHALPSNDNTGLMPRRSQLDALLRKNFVVNGGALLLRRKAFVEAGPYDAALAFGEDWEFWCRLCAQGDFGRVEGGPVLFYRQRIGGANRMAQGHDLRPGRPCLDRVASNPAFRNKYGGRLGRLLRARQIDMFWSGVRNEYVHGSRSKALRLAALGVATYPDSLLRPTLARRLLASLKT